MRCLYRADVVIPSGAFGVDTGMAELALGWLHCLCLGCQCVQRDWFPLELNSCRYVSGVHPLLSGFWLVEVGCFCVRWRFLVWAVQLFGGWPGRSGSDLGLSPWGTKTLQAGGNRWMVGPRLQVFFVDVAVDTFLCNRFSIKANIHR